MAKKLTKRKAFNFLRSYFDVLNEIETDSDKLNYLLAVINKQFLDEDPKDLPFIANLCYESQRHSIETSIKGYKDKTKTDLQGNKLNPIEPPKQHPLQGGRQGGTVDPSQQEKEKEKEKEKEESKEAVFKKNLLTFQENYPLEMLEKFFLYWTEKNPNGKKMKFEMQNTFDIERRLLTWSKNEKNFNGNSNGKMTLERKQELNRNILSELMEGKK